MLDILLMRKSSDFFSYYSDIDHKTAPTIVTPNPQTADLVRLSFDSLGKRVESITISAFIKDKLTSLFDDSVLENFKGKSELLILLVSIWKKLGGSNYAEFTKAFGILTDFRSFSMSADVLETVLENYDEELSHSILLFHRLMEQMEIIDEHKSYFLLSEKLRSGDFSENTDYENDIVFYGFDFMAASQVDLIRSLSIRDNVSIPFYKSAWDKSQGLDWIKWFEKSEEDVIDICSEVEVKLRSKKIEFSKNYLGKYLALYSQEKNVENIVLGVKNAEIQNTLELPVDHLAYKLAIDIFEEEMNIVVEDLSFKECSLDEISTKLKENINIYISQQNFRKIKAALVLLKKISEWGDLSEENSDIDELSFEVIQEAAKLDLPRLNHTSFYTERTETKSLGDLKSLDNIKNKNIVLAINSNHGGLSGAAANYSEKVERYLASIGPIRRGELELAILQGKIEELVEDNRLTLFVEAGLLEHDTAWSSMFSNIEFLEEEFQPQFAKVVNFPTVEVEHFSIDTLSASKLQTYIDCPRKFYYQYVEKLSPQLEFKDKLTVLELGQIEHEVIETFFKEEHKNLEQYDDLVDRILSKYLKVKNHIESTDEYKVEVTNYCLPTIRILMNLRDNCGYSLHFEFPFLISKGLQYNGSIDCFCINEDGTKLILDFKRSNRIFSTFTSIVEFKKIQLWFYLERLIELEQVSVDDDIIIGYVDLSEIENSMLFTNKKEVSLDGLDFTKKIKNIDDFASSKEEYQELEGDSIKKIQAESRFQPMPIDNDACGYCVVKNICPRRVCE